MDSIIAITAQFTRLPQVVPAGASEFRGAVTVWPSKYAGGSETGSAAIKVGTGRNQSVFGLYLDPSAVKEYAEITEPEGLFEFTLGVRASDGAPEFSVVSVELAEGSKRAVAMSASVEAPVLSQVDGGHISVLWHAEAESHLDIAAPAGMAWNPGLEQFVGQTLPSLEIVFERRLVPGAVQSPARARAAGGDARLFVPAHPMADLAVL